MGKKKVIFVETKDVGKDKAIAQVVEKYYNFNEKIILLTYSEERGNFLDGYLWTFKQLSFIPHIFINETGTVVKDEEVVITVFEDNIIDAGVLVLDRPASADFMKRFNIIIDFVDRTNNETLQESRSRYKEYKKSGIFEVIYS